MVFSLWYHWIHLWVVAYPFVNARLQLKFSLLKSLALFVFSCEKLLQFLCLGLFWFLLGWGLLLRFLFWHLEVKVETLQTGHQISVIIGWL